MIQQARMNRGNNPQPTFWSVPPYRKTLRELAGKIKVWEIRFAVAQIFGGFYLLYGMKLVLLTLFCRPPFTPNFVNTNLAAAVTSLPTPVVILIAICCGFAAGGIVWLVIGRALQATRHPYVHYGCWGGLALGAPILPMFAIALPEGRLLLTAIFLLATLFGVGVSLLLCWVIRHDQAQTMTQA